MSARSVKITRAQEQEAADFLVALHRDDDEYLSLDLSRQALHNHFSYVTDEDHADSFLYHFRDQHILAWREVSPRRWRWVRTKEESVNQSALLKLRQTCS